MAALPPPTFDLETWASNYEEGPLLAYRLAHIALRCPALARPAAARAIAIARAGKDVQLYLRLTELAGNIGLADLAGVDTAWTVRRDEENRREQSRLESELRGYKNNLIRESIRMGQEDLATHLLDTGGPATAPSASATAPSSPSSCITPSLAAAGYNAAFHAFGKMRDYCTTPSHMNSMFLRLLHASLLQAVHAQLNGVPPAAPYGSLLANAQRLKNSGGNGDEVRRIAPLHHVSAGIAHLGQADYRAAAAAFLAVSFDFYRAGPVLGRDWERAVATANDVAIYGGLCALATLSRDELVDDVLGGPFRAFLELEPHMRKAMTLYTTAKYHACIATLRRYYADWSLDVFLGARLPHAPVSHVDRLFSRIRERSITAYCSSFSEITLAALAATFPPVSSAADAMEREILAMISAGVLDARLDVVQGLVIATKKDLRASTHLEATQAAEEVERTLLLRLHKVNMTLAALDVPKMNVKGGWAESRAVY